LESKILVDKKDTGSHRCDNWSVVQPQFPPETSQILAHPPCTPTTSGASLVDWAVEKPVRRKVDISERKKRRERERERERERDRER
jgi:hypothetical protein